MRAAELSGSYISSQGFEEMGKRLLLYCGSQKASLLMEQNRGSTQLQPLLAFPIFPHFGQHRSQAHLKASREPTEPL